MEFSQIPHSRPVRLPIISDETNDQFTPVELPSLQELLQWEEKSAEPTVIPPPASFDIEGSTETTGLAWQIPEEEGQLAIDVYETDEQIVVMSAIAGVRANELELELQQDMFTVRGTRQIPPLAGEPLVQECYWGKFSRTIILPHAVDPSSVSARLSAGILTITLDKLVVPDSIQIIEMDEDETQNLDPEL